MHEHAFPPGATPRVIPKRSGQTLAGLLKTSREVWLQELILPEFSCSCRIDEQRAFVFSGSCDYDIIFGRDFLRKVGMITDFKLGTMTAFDITTPMKHKSFYTNPFSALSNIIDDIKDGQDDCFHSTQILASKYDKVDIDKVVANQNHLNSKQQSDLHKILSKCTKLFSGKLGHYKAKKMHLELLPGAQPKHAKPYSVPRHLLEVF
jgi:hypothetical protein